MTSASAIHAATFQRPTLTKTAAATQATITSHCKGSANFLVHIIHPHHEAVVVPDHLVSAQEKAERERQQKYGGRAAQKPGLSAPLAARKCSYSVGPPSGIPRFGHAPAIRVL